jgi:sialic acid synthase SpsE
MEKVKIQNKLVGDGEPCFIIAEIGCNHDGNLEQAKKLIDLAVQAKCDAVKFQFFSAEKLFNEHFDYAESGVRKDWISFLQSVGFKKEWQKVIKDYCKQKNIIFFSSVCDEESADELSKLNAPAFKIPSYELTHIPLLNYVARKRKPVIISSGIAKESEIKEAITIIKKAGNKNIILMHCVSAYPTKFEELNLKTISYYKKKFGVPVGLSDHSIGIDSSVLAVAAGANIVEKHITIDKTLTNPDHKFALEGQEIAEWVKKIREAEKALGKIKTQPAPGEKDQVLWRRAIWAKEDIKKGEIFTKENTMIVRPSPKGTMQPKMIYKILNKKSKKNVKKGEPVSI